MMSRCVGRSAGRRREAAGLAGGNGSSQRIWQQAMHFRTLGHPDLPLSKWQPPRW